MESLTIGVANLRGVQYDLVSLDGLDEIAPWRGTFTEIPGRHGAIQRARKFGPGRIALQFIIFDRDSTGATAATYEARRAQLDANLDALLRELYLPTNFPLTRTRNDGAVRITDAKVDSVAPPVNVGQTMMRLTVDFTLPDSFWRDSADTTVEIDPTSASQTSALPGFGGATAPTTDLRVEVDGPTTGVCEIVDSGSNTGFKFTSLTIPVGQQLVVDSAAFTATLNGVDVLASMTHGSTYLFSLSSGNLSTGPYIRTTFGTIGTETRVRFIGKRKYLR